MNGFQHRARVIHIRISSSRAGHRTLRQGTYLCISPQIHPQNVNVFGCCICSFSRKRMESRRRNQKLMINIGGFLLHCASGNSIKQHRQWSPSMACWSSDGVLAWPAGRPREYQHSLLVVPAQRASTPKDLRAHLCLAVLP